MDARRKKKRRRRTAQNYRSAKISNLLLWINWEYGSCNIWTENFKAFNFVLVMIFNWFLHFNWISINLNILVEYVWGGIVETYLTTDAVYASKDKFDDKMNDCDALIPYLVGSIFFFFTSSRMMNNVCTTKNAINLILQHTAKIWRKTVDPFIAIYLCATFALSWQFCCFNFNRKSWTLWSYDQCKRRFFFSLSYFKWM